MSIPALQRIRIRAAVVLAATVLVAALVFSQTPKTAAVKTKKAGAVAKVNHPEPAQQETAHPPAVSGMVSSFIATHPVQSYHVKLNALPEEVQIGEGVRFTIVHTLPTNRPEIRFRIDYADGTQDMVPLIEPQSIHTYESVGSYHVVTTLIHYGETGAITLVSGYGDSTVVRVDSVSFDAYPVDVMANQTVSFRIHFNPSPGQLVYKFYFGDGSPPTAWTASTDTSYTYTNRGQFSAFAEIGRFAKGNIYPITITIARNITVSLAASPAPKPTLTLNANVSSADTGQAVIFVASLNPPTQGVSYRFDFGDRKKVPPSPNSTVEYKYHAPGRFTPTVRAIFNHGSLIAGASPIIVSLPREKKIPVWVWAVVALVVVGGAAMATPKIIRLLRPPRVSFDLKSDPGVPRTPNPMPKIALIIVLKRNLASVKVSIKPISSKLVSTIRRKHV